MYFKLMISCQAMRAFSMFPELDVTAVILDISTHLHFRLVVHQLKARKVNICDELSGALQCSWTLLVQLWVCCDYLSSAHRFSFFFIVDPMSRLWFAVRPRGVDYVLFRRHVHEGDSFKWTQSRCLRCARRTLGTGIGR